MNPADTARVLAKCQSYDRRTVGAADIAAWHEALDDIDLPDALNAVAAHYRDSEDWLTPARIRKLTRGTNAGAPYNRTVAEASLDGTLANCGHGYADPQRACGICRRGGVREVGAA